MIDSSLLNRPPSPLKLPLTGSRLIWAPPDKLKVLESLPMRFRLPLVGTSLLVVAFGSLATGLPLHAQEDNSPPEGYTALFNGENLDGWYGMPHQNPYDWAAMSEDDRQGKLDQWNQQVQQHWSVQSGAIVNDGQGAYLTTEKEFSNFDLWIDYKTVAQADSGIYLKATPQVQIWDYTKEGGKWNIGADKGSGGLWNNSPGTEGKDPLVLADKPFGQWNRLRIKQVGQRTSVWLNDRLVVDHALMENYWDRSLPLPASGPIQLQTHGGEIQWKNIFVKELTSQEAIEFLREQPATDLSSVFDGESFEGWSGPTENYQIVDGSIQCKAGTGGTIFTDKEYGDFKARLEFQLPPGGNNGLAIRYPGQGDTAYVGLCELQVLDNTADKYAELDPRQYHGSAYGMIAAKRGYLNPVGDWNFQEVTVQGSRITVELNGSVILDGDLSEVTDYMAGSPHPGKERTKGHFGFAGHGDPVRFRNIAIGEISP